MLELIRLNSAPKLHTISRDGIDIVVIERLKDVLSSDLLKYDAILVQSLKRRMAVEILREIRTSSNLMIALKPVLLSSSIAGSQRISYLFDGMYSDVEFALRIQSIKEIIDKTKSLRQNILIHGYESSLALQAIRFCYTRNIKLSPTLNRASSIGYSYLFLSSVIEEEQSLKIIQFLEKFESDGYFTKHVVDQIQSCKKCSSGYLNYRETCPSCGSKDLKTEDLIHHFSCAHVAPESDFKKNDSLECPKCSKTLRHIGIDYDKPSSVYTCNSCDHEFQNPQIKALCVDCGCENELNELTGHLISEYELTSKGEHTAKTGIIESHKKPIKESSNSISIQVFEFFRSQEIKRLEHSATMSWEGSIKLNSDLVKNFSDFQKSSISKEIQEIISSYLNETDLLSSVSACWHRFILFDKDPILAEQTGELIQNNITKLLTDSLNDHTHNVELLLTSLKPE
jgi:hypothetical protein